MPKQSSDEKKKQPHAWLTPDIALQLVQSALAYCEMLEIAVNVIDSGEWSEIKLDGVKAERVDGAWVFTVRPSEMEKAVRDDVS